MLNESQIKKFIDDDALSDQKRAAAVGQRYYDGEHDILNYRMYYYNTDGLLVEDKARSNSRICHPFFTELVDQLAAYICSFDENPIQAKPGREALQDELDTYFDSRFWAEIQELISGAYAKGSEYLYAYIGKDDILRFMCADSIGVVEVRANDTDDGCEYVIYWYIDRIGIGKKKIKRIEVHGEGQIWFYSQIDDGRIVLDDNEPINPRPNVVWSDPKTGKKYGDSLGFFPFWRLDNCKKRFSGLKPIKGLIDDYDLMQCGLSNNLQDFDNPVYLVKGYHSTDLGELQQNIKTKKIMGVDPDGGLDILTVDVPYQARKAKADEDEKNIYRFGMGLNTNALKDTSATTSIAIKMAYTLLDLKAKKLIMRLQRVLTDILEVVLAEINKKQGTDYKRTDVTVEFEPHTPINEQERVQNEKIEAETEQLRLNSILNVATVIGDEETLRSVCEILDLDFEELQPQLETLREEQNTNAAIATLEGVVTDEQASEAGAAEIP